jgi:hypothetical protein
METGKMGPTAFVEIEPVAGAQGRLVRTQRSSGPRVPSPERSIEALVRKLLADPAERRRIARVAARYGDGFGEGLQSELNRIGLSLFGLRVTLGICHPGRLGEGEIVRIINYLGLRSPIQGRHHAPELRLVAVLRSIGSER